MRQRMKPLINIQQYDPVRRYQRMVKNFWEEEKDPSTGKAPRHVEAAQIAGTMRRFGFHSLKLKKNVRKDQITGNKTYRYARDSKKVFGTFKGKKIYEPIDTITIYREGNPSTGAKNWYYTHERYENGLWVSRPGTIRIGPYKTHKEAAENAVVRTTVIG